MGWGDQPGTRGLLTAVRRNLDGTNLSDVSYAYDSYGNRTSVTEYGTYGSYSALGGDPRTTTVQYDTTYHAFPTVTTNALAHSETTSYDPGTGRLLSKTDANGATWRYSYDTFGRITEVRDPLEAPTDAATVKYAYDTTTVPYRVTTQRRKDDGGANPADYFTTRQFFDGLGRLVQEYSDTVNGVSLKNVHYDNRGLKAWESVPREIGQPAGYSSFMSAEWNSATQPQTQYVYDGLGRVSTVTNPDSTRKRTYYSDWLVSSVDENNHAKYFISDVFGRLARVQELKGTCYSGCNDPWTVVSTTDYSYDVLNNLTLVVDAAGNRTTMGYDKLGRKVDMVDPDMGHWTYTYNAQGNLQTQTDAKGQVITFSYDPLNRLTSKESPVGTPLASYVYDSNNGDTSSFATGHRTSMADPSGSTRWYYDKNGRLSKEIETIDGVEYPTTYTYNAMDQSRTVTYPDGEVVANSYDVATRLSSVVGADSYVASATHNAQGQIKSLGLSNEAIQTHFGYYGYNAAGWGDPTYDAPSSDGLGSLGRLWRINTKAAGQTLQELQHGYDAVGNVTSVDDARTGSPGGLMTFQYDHLDRLTSAFPDAGTYNGYDQTFQYDRTGNITAKTNASTATQYYYDPAHPHAVNQLRDLQTLLGDSFSSGSSLNNWDTYGSWSVVNNSYYSGQGTTSSDSFPSAAPSNWAPQSGSWTPLHDGTYSGVATDTTDGFGALTGWTSLYGTWAAEGGELSNTAGGTMNLIKWDQITNTSRTFSWEADVREIGSTAGAMGIAFRVQDYNNWYVAFLHAGQVKVARKVNGVYAQIAAASFPWSANTWYRLKVYVEGQSIRVYVNGAMYIYLEDTSLTWGSVGFTSTGAHHHYDNATFRSNAYTLANISVPANFSYSARVRTSSATYSPVLVFRWLDDANHYYVQYAGDGVRLYRKLGGQIALLQIIGPAPTWPLDWQTMKVVVNNNNINVYVNDALYINYTDAAIASGRIGMMTIGQTYYDDVTVADIYGNSLLFDSSFNNASGWSGWSGGWTWENGEYSSYYPAPSRSVAIWSSGPIEGPIGATYQVTAREEIGAASGSFGMVFRYQDGGNWYMVELTTDAGIRKMRFYKRQGNVGYVLAETPFAWQQGVNYTFKAIVYGSDIRVYVDGTMLRFNDSAFGPGRLALSSVNGHHHFDNASITSYGYSVSKLGADWADYTFSARVQKPADTDSINLYFRWQDANNFYWVALYGSGLLLGKKVNGVWTELASNGAGTPARPPGVWYTVKVEVNGSNIKAYIDNVLYIDAYDGSLSRGKVAMNANYRGYYDDVTVVGLNAASFTAQYDPNGNLTSGGVRTITWDKENRPTQITYDGNTTSFVYDGDGKRVKKTGPATTFAEGFQSGNANWTYSPYQTVPYVDNGQYTIRSTGTNADYSANFYRNAYSVPTGNEVRFEFKVDATETYAHFALENDTGGTYRRWAFISAGGKAFVQYADDTGWYYPQDLINPVKTNTWYVAILRADDINGFKIDVHERDNPSVVGTYTRPMPTGLSWRFHHWIWRNTSYIANYVERKVNGGTTVYVGNLFEKNTSTGEVTKYYYAEGRRIAMRKVGGANPGLSYLLSDHLGGTVGVVDANGSLKDGYYFAYGGSRLGGGGMPTDRLFTGQTLDGDGLYQVGSRHYDPAIGRFLQPDPMGQLKLNDSAPFLPLTVSYSDPGLAIGLGQWNRGQRSLAAPLDPQLLNRYSYSRNNPETYYDPSGHFVWMIAGALIGGGVYVATHWDQVQRGEVNYAEAGLYVLGGAAGGAIAEVALPAAGAAVAPLFQRASVWAQPPLQRGIQIENQLGRNLPQNFPVVDRFENGVVTSIKSIDLTAKSYQNVDTLTRTVKGYVDAMAAYQGQEPAWAGRAITADEITGRAVDLAIPSSGWTQAQMIALQELQKYATSVNVTLNIIPVQ
ncbi:MAG: hypothetical protein M1343_05560 [Chloroflexi bacterium]|nr:hypothetical protein [Chloroflexota bacterium]